MTEKEKLQQQLEQLKEKKKEYEIKADNCDVLQHSLKIFLNSAYGAFGSVYYPLYDIDIAESTTIGGKTATQEMVRYVNWYMNKLQGTENDEFVIAGDTDSCIYSSKVSINGKSIGELFDEYSKKCTPLLLNNNKDLKYCTEIIDLIANGFIEYTYSLNGKTKIKNISRHKVNKSRYLIQIDNNSVEVTGDHSIMVYRNGQVIECKANEIKDTDYLLQRKS